MSNNLVLTDVNGEQILPITTSENVFTSSSETLKETLERISQNGNGGAYVLPNASLETLGGVKLNVVSEVPTEFKADVITFVEEN